MITLKRKHRITSCLPYVPLAWCVHHDEIIVYKSWLQSAIKRYQDLEAKCIKDKLPLLKDITITVYGDTGSRTIITKKDFEKLQYGIPAYEVLLDGLEEETTIKEKEEK